MGSHRLKRLRVWSALKGTFARSATLGYCKLGRLISTDAALACCRDSHFWTADNCLRSEAAQPEACMRFLAQLSADVLRRLSTGEENPDFDVLEKKSYGKRNSENENATEQMVVLSQRKRVGVRR